MFDLDGERDYNSPTYILKAVICFVGAHYFSYIKQKSHPMHSKKKCTWKLYDDDRPIF